MQLLKGEDGFLRIRLEDMFYAVINAVKELDNRTSAQEKKIKELEKRIEELEKSKNKKSGKVFPLFFYTT